MKRRTFAGLPVVVENEAGSTRQWHDRDGRESGSVVMRFDYGFIEGQVGSDGDEVDCYLGPDEGARFVYVVHQLKAPEFERHDEDKVMLGFASESDAKVAFLAHRNDGERAYGGMSVIPLESFVTKLERRTGTGKIRYERTAMAANEMAPALSGPSHAFDAGVGSDGKISIHVWDRFTSWGPKHKNEPVEFNETTLGQMVDNWRARGGALAMCQDHKSAAAPLVAAPALAFYDALAVVRGGQVLRFEKLVMSAATAPDPALLKAKVAAFASVDDPSPEPDGLWGFRAEVTPLGEDPREGLRNYRYISPFFTDKGTDEQKNPIGYVLADVAATNTPFQGACPITLSQSHQPSAPRSTEMSMNPEMLKKLGLSESASAEEKKAALKKYASECATKMSELEGEEAKKMADDLEGMAAYAEGEDGEKMKKLSAKFRRFAAPAKTDADGDHDGDKKKEEAAAKETMMAFAQRLGVQLPANATREQMMTALQAASVKASDLPAIIEAQLARTLADRDAKREAADCAEKSKILMSQLRDDTPEVNRKALESLSKDPKTIESAIALAAPFLRADVAPTSILFSRMTAGGSPLGLPDAGARTPVVSPARGERVVNNAIGTFRIHGEEFSGMAKQWADAKEGPVKLEIDSMLTEATVAHPGERLIAANRLLKQKRPDLWATAEEWRF